MNDRLFPPTAHAAQTDARPASAVLFARNGEVTFQRPYGVEVLDARHPASAETAFYLCSASKPITATAVALLAERGLLRYDDPVADFLPEAPPFVRAVTLRQLPLHTSGIPDYLHEIAAYLALPCIVLLGTLMNSSTAYRFAAGLALASAFLIVWMSVAAGLIGIEDDDPANLLYVGVLAIGLLGALVARFQPGGLARALFATALAQAVVAVFALNYPNTASATAIVLLHGLLVALFAGSAWLFRYAAREQLTAAAERAG
jgi:hypothetical protein